MTLISEAQVGFALSEHAKTKIGLSPKLIDSQNHISIPAVCLKFTQNQRLFIQFRLSGLSGTHLYVTSPVTYLSFVRGVRRFGDKGESKSHESPSVWRSRRNNHSQHSPPGAYAKWFSQNLQTHSQTFKKLAPGLHSKSQRLITDTQPWVQWSSCCLDPLFIQRELCSILKSIHVGARVSPN